MTQPSHVRVLAQTDPVPNLTSTWGQVAQKARHRIGELEAILRDLDRVTDQLSERGVKVDVDLGPIGNAAAAARRDLEKPPDGRPTFTLPRT